MPSYYSKEGVWHPTKEHAVLPHLTGTDKEVYDGADRAALYELWKAGQTNFGQNFKSDPQFLQSVRNQGFNTVDEYLKFVGYDEKAAQADFEKNAQVVNKHEVKKFAKEIKMLGGGTDLAGGGLDRYGGFGDEGQNAR